MPSLHHTAFVVTDVDRSIAFYERFFGAELEVRFDHEGKALAELHGLPVADATLALVRIGDARLELFQFRKPDDGRFVAVRACDIGSTHVAVAVDDVASKYEEMTQAGIEFTTPPVDGGGYVVAFCVDPDGNRLELLQLP